MRQRVQFNGLSVRSTITRGSVFPDPHGKILVTMQEIANEVNKMKRASSRSLLVPWRVYLFHRRPVTKGCQKLDLTSGRV
jgi:hypothetical protein